MQEIKLPVDSSKPVAKVQVVKYLSHDGRIYFQLPYRPDVVSRFKREFGGRRWHGSVGEKPSKWQLPAPVRELFGTVKLWSAPDDSRTRFRLGAWQGRDTDAYWRSPYPTNDFDRPLYAHQKEAVDWLLAVRWGILAYEMRLGKTLVFIEVMERAAALDSQAVWWHYCPKSAIAEMELQYKHWDAEVRPKLFTDGELKRLAASDETPDGVIFDESHRLKTPTAARSKAALAIAERVRRANGYVVCATGTPAPHDPTNWWTQAEIACPGWIPEARFYDFDARLAERAPHIPGISFPKLIRWREDEVEKLKTELSGLVLAKFQRDVFDVPARQYERIELPPSKQTLRFASLIKSQSESTIETLVKMRELSDGFQYKEKLSGQAITRLTTPKDQALTNLLDKYIDAGRIVIYAGFTASVDRCVEICQAQGWDTIRVDGRGWDSLLPSYIGSSPLEVFQDVDKYPRPTAFIGHPGAAGMGLTLSASPAVVFYSNDFDGEHRIQAEERIFAPGKICTVYDFLHLPTDKLILDNLHEKRRLQALTLGDIWRLYE
jgi:SNF2 family DNA or RNA helicase